MNIKDIFFFVSIIALLCFQIFDKSNEEESATYMVGILIFCFTYVVSIWDASKVSELKKEVKKLNDFIEKTMK